MNTDPASTTPPPPRPRWYHNMWVVLVMLFFVLGPLGLPLLWKSPHFSQPVKIGLSVLVIVFTVWILVSAGQLVSGMFHEIDTLPSLR